MDEDIDEGMKKKILSYRFNRGQKSLDLSIVINIE